MKIYYLILLLNIANANSTNEAENPALSINDKQLLDPLIETLLGKECQYPKFYQTSKGSKYSLDSTHNTYIRYKYNGEIQTDELPNLLAFIAIVGNRLKISRQPKVKYRPLQYLRQKLRCLGPLFNQLTPHIKLL